MELYLNLDTYQAKKVFTDISDVISFVKVKLFVLEYLLTSWHGNIEVKKTYIFVDTDILHRAFLVNSNGKKIISFGFEFIPKIEKNNQVSSNDDAVNNISHFNYLGKNGKISAKEISQSHTLLNSITLKNEFLYCFSGLNGVEDEEDQITDDSRTLLEFLLFAEAGYFRFDNSAQGYNKNTHPLNHLDINYSNICSFKLGLRSQIDLNDINEFLKRKNSCPEIKLSGQNFPSTNPKTKLRRRRKLKK